MHSGTGQLMEIHDGTGMGRGLIHCPDSLTPAPGQYVLAAPLSEKGVPSFLPAAIFSAGPAENGFFAASALPHGWEPGIQLALRGPLGKGFNLPEDCRRLALVAWEMSPESLLALLPRALAQWAEVTLVCKSTPASLPEIVEIQPMAILDEVCNWADAVAIEAAREALPDICLRLEKLHQARIQVLIHTAMPCGALAECGACAVRVRDGWKLVCKDGPVFDLNYLRE